MSESNPPIRILFDTLNGLDRPEDRDAFLDYTCRGDEALRGRLERLVALQTQARDFFDIETAPAEPPAATGPGTDDATEAVGSRIGCYRLVERIGEGGWGAVYLAEQLEPVKRRVALKIIRLGMDTENVIARFEMERQALAMMDHPNIARVFDVGATRSGRPFFVMQLVDGEKITDYCDAKRLGLAERLKLFIPVCQAIQHAHQKGVIHRDIKPSNVLVWEHEGVVIPKVIDFGISKAAAGGVADDATLTLAGQFVGTPAYMSPEQASGGGVDVDTRSDIYSLGAMLYELLAGRPPFDPAELREIGVDEIRHLLREVDPRDPSSAVAALSPEVLRETAARRNCEPSKLGGLLRGDLDRVVMKAMAKDRRFRYATAEALAADVARFLHDEPVTARPPRRLYRFGKLVRRNRVAFGAGAIVFLSLLLGLGGTSWMFFRSNQARIAAERARASEAELRRKAEYGENIAHAAVLLKYDRLKEADELLDEIPPESARPSLESAETFQALGLWHAKEERWRKAADRFAALAYSLANVDSADTEWISLSIMPAAAALCEIQDFESYEKLRTMALDRFSGTSNPVVAEQMIKVCLMRPATPRFLARLDSLMGLLAEPREQPGEWGNLVLWRMFSMGLMEYRRGHHSEAAGWMRKCLQRSGSNLARDVMAREVLAMALLGLDATDEARVVVGEAREILPDHFSTPGEIFRHAEPHWTDWVFARVLLRESDAALAE